MKNLKKVLALVLAFACAFTMFAGAVVYPDVPAGSEYSEAITMLSDLGIIQGKTDGKYHADESITRAEACALIARMLTGDPDVSQYAGASNFTDVVKGTWQESVVGYCVVNGITVGVGNNKFEPNRPITDAEFVTMVVRAMGYETTGTSYPYGHISAAQANGLLDDVTVVPSSAALRGEDAQIIYNALFADYARGAKRVNTTHGTTVEEYPTIAEDVFGLAKAVIVNNDKTVHVGVPEGKKCQAHTWVILGVDSRKADAFVAAPIEDDETDLYTKAEDAYTFTYTGDLSVIEALKGYKVELYGDEQHKTSTPEIKAILSVKGQTAYGNDVDTDDVDVEKVMYPVRVIEKDTEDIAKQHTVYDTDKLAYAVKTMDAEKELDQNDSRVFTIIDWDSDGTADFAVCDKKFYGQVSFLDKDEITVDALGGKDFDWELDDEDAISVEKNKASYVVNVAEDVEDDDIVEITRTYAYGGKSDGEVITLNVEKAEVVTETYEKRGSNKTYIFEGSERKIADNTIWELVEAPAFTNDQDTEWDLYLDTNGNIVFADKIDAKAKGYAMVLDTENGEPKRTGKQSESKVKGSVDLLTAEGETVSYWVDDELEIDVNGAYNTVDDFKWHEDGVVGYVFKYWVDDDDVITEMERVDDTAGDFSYDDTGSRNNRIKVDGVNYTLDDSDGLFAVLADFVEKDKNLDKDVKVNTDKVLAVKAEDLPEKIGDKSSNDTCKAAAAAGKMVEPFMGKALTGKIDDAKRELSAATLVVDSFKGFGNTDVKAGLVAFAYETKSGNKHIYEIKVAMDGKYDFVKTEKVSDYKDLFENANALDTFDNIVVDDNNNYESSTYGLYCELYFNKDGEVEKIVPMTKVAKTTDNGVEEYEGDFYSVFRGVVDTYNADKKYMTMLGARAKDDKNLYSVFSADDFSKDLDFASDITNYTIDQYPKVVAGDVINTKDGFLPKMYKEIEATTTQKVSKIYNDKLKDKYVVADVVLNSKGDVYAVYTFDKSMGEAGNYSDVVTIVPDGNVTHDAVYGEAMPGDAGNTYGYNSHKWIVKQGGKDVLPADIKAITIKNPADGLEANVADNAIAAWHDIEMTTSAITPVGKYEIEVELQDGAKGTFEFKVVKADMNPTLAPYNCGTEVWVNSASVPSGSTITGKITRVITTANNGIQEVTVATLSFIKSEGGYEKLAVNMVAPYTATQADDKVSVTVTNPNYNDAEVSTTAIAAQNS